MMRVLMQTAMKRKTTPLLIQYNHHQNTPFTAMGIPTKTGPNLNRGSDARMPKLRTPSYYTIPSIQELAAKERAEPGYCRSVKDFIVGRHGYGSIRFLDESEVCGKLSIGWLFNHREVIVYKEESNKPGIGLGLNKPAIVSLLNIKCVDKRTGEHYVDGPKVKRYEEMLTKKAEEQGAQFVSYDPVMGGWKFRVKHF